MDETRINISNKNTLSIYEIGFLYIAYYTDIYIMILCIYIECEIMWHFTISEKLIRAKFKRFSTVCRTVYYAIIYIIRVRCKFVMANGLRTAAGRMYKTVSYNTKCNFSVIFPIAWSDRKKKVNRVYAEVKCSERN